VLAANSLDKLARFFRNSPGYENTHSTSLTTFAFVCLGLFPNAQGVLPPPDGGYPNFTTAEGTNALKNLTTGAANTAVGWFSLFGDTTASFNTGVGAGTLLFNNGDQNTASGVAALLNNTTGSFNTATGVSALSSNTTGVSNNAFGWGALLSNTTGTNNTAIGVRALQSNTEGNTNVAVGETALGSNTTGIANIAIGYQALLNNTSSANMASGYGALEDNTTGEANTAYGINALSQNTTGSHNTALGTGAGVSVTTATNVIAISANGENVSNTCYIGNIFGVTSAGAAAVYVNSDGKLGTTPSSKRFKAEIKPMDKASEVLLALKPVTFHYKSDAKGTPQFGLVAEEVAEMNPDLVVRDKEGGIYTVRYEQINAMLLNEFLKEHHRNEEQQATIARLQKQIEALTAGLQRVSAQLEAGKHAPQVVNNP
jgi:hypothetical protein